MGSIEVLNGHAYCLCFLNGSRFSVVLVLTYRLWKACFHAGTAIDAFKGIIRYLATFQTDFYSVGWTYSSAITTQITLIGIKIDFAPISGERLPYVLKRITPGSGSGEQVFHNRRKHPHFLSPLSTTYTGVNRQGNHRHISHLTARQHN